MAANIKKKFEEIEKSRIELFKEIEHLDDESFNWKPGPKKWSIAQVLHHLCIAEENTLNYIYKKTQSPDLLLDAGVKEMFRSQMLRLWLKLPFKYNAPKVVQDVPEHSGPVETINHYNKIRKHWEHFIDNVPESFIRKKIFRHPFSGRMDLIMTLDFMRDHADRHHKQIRKVLKAQSKRS